MEVSDQIHAPAALPLEMNSGTHSLGGSWGSRAGGWFLKKRKYSAQVGIRTPDHLARS